MKTVEQAANELQAAIEEDMYRRTKRVIKATIEYDAAIRREKKAQKKGGGEMK